MTTTFCTIITSDYYPRVLALYVSLKQFGHPLQLQVLIADDKPVSGYGQMPDEIVTISANSLSGYSLTDKLYKKFHDTDMDSFRWSMKPVFMSYLLEREFEKVICLDCDMYFFNDYGFLFSELDSCSVLLTPEWTNSDPLTDKKSFLSVFSSGFFSAGFIGANRKGLPALQWWANACHFMTGKQHSIRADQKYLDFFPVQFEDIKILRHRIAKPIKETND